MKKKFFCFWRPICNCFQHFFFFIFFFLLFFLTKGNFLPPNYPKRRPLSSGALVAAPPWPRGSMFPATRTFKVGLLQSFPFLSDFLQNGGAPTDKAAASVTRETGARWVSK